MLDDAQTILKENTVLVVIASVILLAVLGYGVMTLTQPADTDLTPTPPNETGTPTPEPFEPYPVNTTETLDSHRTTLEDSAFHTLIFTASVDNTEQHTLRTRVYNDIFYSVQTDSVHGQSELWSNGNTTYNYDVNDSSVTEVTSTQFDDRKTKSYFVQRVFDAGEYWYTDSNTFELRNTTDTQALLFAFPTISGQADGNVTNVTITGTIEDGVVTHMEGEFTYTPAFDGAESYQYSFELTVEDSYEPIETPNWVPVEETTTETPTETDSSNSTNTTNTTATETADSQKKSDNV